jgi:hypothetical protein
VKIVKELESMDCIAETGDVVDVRVQDSIISGGGKMLYVDVNGRTILRVGRIEPNNLQINEND